MTTNTLPPAYLKVRDELIEEGYDEPMETPAEVRSTLRGMLLESEHLERRYRDLLSELADTDDEGTA